jgi:hypothetical protein
MPHQHGNQPWRHQPVDHQRALLGRQLDGG